ncbi:putative multidrug resistance protein MdtD [wastewater metagenome]|uniref:Putative multidrug resistance protein MdtD n=2 Tax=unclassified sequences TaxID=12908 RepID=A0A5B8RI18_9ZZZZ|nr:MULTISPECIES: MFS transporter [Arhodomonas]QEA06615.1 putative multidrug resistance protein MdtD [uncultured organism]
MNAATNTDAPSPGSILAVAAAGPLLVLVAFTLPLTTLMSTAGALGVGPGIQAWIMSGMSVGAAAGLLSSGAIGDDYGRRRVFVGGALLLAIASILGALAPTALVLVIARVLGGLGGAAILACGLGLIGHTFPSGAPRARATGVWAAALGAGVAIGPLLSAGLDHLGGWRLPYVFTALAATALAGTARRVLPESRAPVPRRIDLAGTLLLGGGIAALLSALVEGRMGWDRPLVVALLVLGLVLLAGFVAVERRIEGPMLDIALFRCPDFLGATTAAFAAGAGVLSLVSSLPMLLERALGTSTLLSALMLLAWSATSVVTAFGVRWLPTGVTPRTQLIAGLLGSAAGQLGLIGLSLDGTLTRLLPALLIAGAAYGVLNAALGRQAVASVPAGRTAMGSGANNTARYLGSAAGLALVTVLVTHAGPGSGPAGLLAGWNVAVLVTAGFSLLGALVVFFAHERPAPETAPARENTPPGSA